MSFVYEEKRILCWTKKHIAVFGRTVAAEELCMLKMYPGDILHQIDHLEGQIDISWAQEDLTQAMTSGWTMQEADLVDGAFNDSIVDNDKAGRPDPVKQICIHGLPTTS